MKDATSVATQPHELKWVLPARRAGTVAHWLGSRLRTDPRYPRAVVVSLYYDTPDWRLLGEKTDSDFLKTKLRLRWYEDADGGTLGETAFIEVKTKTGARRDKLRIAAPWPASELARLPLSDARFRIAVDLARAAGARLPAPLLPAFALSYERHRYIDPATGSRVALDREIGLRGAHPRLPAVRRPRLEVAVLEVKGHGRSLTVSMRRVTTFGARLAAFSKYAACHALLMGAGTEHATGGLPG